MGVCVARRQFTVDEYHRLGTAGVLRPDERVELFDGEIVRMTPIGQRHAVSVARVNEVFVRRVGGRAAIWPQMNPVRLGPLTELQPDLALLVPPLDRYRGRVVSPADVLLVVEVADTSLRYDRLKARRYAAAGVPEMWIVDLAHERLEMLREPGPAGYGDVRHLGREGTVGPAALPDLVVRVDDLL